MYGVNADLGSDDSFDDLTSDELSQMLSNSTLLKALSELNEREQQVVRLRFGLTTAQARTLEEVGGEFGVTRERIREIESKTLAKLRLGRRDGGDATGVREPRRPLPTAGAGHVQMELDSDN
jgi:DNA-directed RNA polymerase sigma subunit (sigma70/sigma32)